MKSILIINNNMHMGGVQKALLNLLNEIHNDYDISLLLFSPCGELYKYIPDNVKIVSPNSFVKYWGITRNDIKTNREWFFRAFLVLLTKIFGRGFAFRVSSCFQKKIVGYDVVISYLHSGNPKAFYGGCAEFAAYYTKANYKIIFLHNDFRMIHADSQYNTRLYSKFNYVAACSEGCKNAFCSVIPQIKDRVVVIRNCIDFDNIRKLALKDPIRLNKKNINIVTVARLGKEKGILRAIKSIRNLLNIFPQISYFIIGDGAQYREAKNYINDNNLQNNIHLLGKMINPYGYIKAADLFLLPSYTEAAPLVVEEAACLATPIISTCTSSSQEMISETGYGWVCENSDESLTITLKKILQHPSIIERKHEFLLNVSFNDQNSKDEFERLIELCKK